jgi:hypothetical protein
MTRLRKATLQKNESTSHWDLIVHESDRILQSFPTKEQATAAGSLEEALGEAGVSVMIRDEHGRFQEERTFPRTKDPKRTRG